ncbi:3'(2'),5'-bisphosphate nucleotidase CysQ [Gallalistipes aquisgranensis]|uniref:3'(2'),5'-bisphosphate nucleotidase CysQ n=1 Tax=Gallalistipes aquisgranensis TaxID=2779358 RepID=UPI001CF887C5|nr:3'(2'),5'-bisphosphate nucleotidase CysQ [Gallalistipes aquisgranensis]MBE5033850.1 3'(2'),5'-bisphosphate nucleotidase CysQ [Gallalistipes aquisgranensis]
MLSIEQREYLLPKAYNAALRAGAVILETYSHAEDYAIDIKQDLTPITLADRQSHNLIKEYLGQTRIPILSEEGREMLYEERRGWDLFWMVDPLDGTKEFIKGNGEFTVNIALMADNEPVLAVIYVPYIRKIYFCDKCTGAFRKEEVAPDPKAELTQRQIMEQAQPLPVAKACNDPIRIAVSRSHNTEETFEHIDRMKEKFPKAEVIEQGSSYKFCLLAEGSIEYYIRTSNTYEWDTAAGELILSAAGGEVVSHPDRQKLRYNKESLLNPHFVCRSKFMPN